MLLAWALMQLGKFKLRLVVPSQIRRKAELEEKLAKMEEAVKGACMHACVPACVRNGWSWMDDWLASKRDGL